MNKRKHTFDKYHANRVSDREKRVKKALKLIQHGSFTSLTPLAKQVADIINAQYELEAEYNADVDAKPKKMNYTSLIRKGSNYRNILLAYLSETTQEPTDSFEKQYQDLLIHCANIEEENELLRNRLAHLGGKSSSESGTEALEGISRINDIQTLIKIIDAMKSIAPELSFIVSENEVSKERPVPGLYSVRGLVLDMGTLVRLEEIRREFE